MRWMLVTKNMNFCLNWSSVCTTTESLSAWPLATRPICCSTWLRTCSRTVNSKVRLPRGSSRTLSGAQHGCAGAPRRAGASAHLRLAELWIDELVASYKGDAQLCGHYSPATLDGDVVPLTNVVDVDRDGGICSSMGISSAAPVQQTKVH